jgi:hypothetical protein
MYIKANHPSIGESYKKMVLGFVLITVMLVAVIFYFSASKAVVEITPKSAKVETDFVADVVTDNSGAAGVALNAQIKDAEVEGAVEEEASGLKDLEGNSIGKVVIYNKRGESQTLVKTTRLQTPTGIVLRIVSAVNIPANGQAEADVYADNPLAFTELAPTKMIVPGLTPSMQQFVYAENKATLFPTGKSVKVIKAVDVARAKDKIDEQVFAKAIDDWTKELGEKKFTVMIVSKKVVSEELSDPIETVKDKFTLKEKVKISMIALEQDKVIELAGAKLQANVPEGQQLLSLNMQNFSYKVQNFDEAKKTANVRVHVEGELVIKSDNKIFDKEKLSGLSPKAVELYLSNFDTIEAVKVNLSPFWVKKIPSMKDHIFVTVVNQPTK